MVLQLFSSIFPLIEQSPLLLYINGNVDRSSVNKAKSSRSKNNKNSNILVHTRPIRRHLHIQNTSFLPPYLLLSWGSRARVRTLHARAGFGVEILTTLQGELDSEEAHNWSSGKNAILIQLFLIPSQLFESPLMFWPLRILEPHRQSRATWSDALDVLCFAHGQGRLRLLSSRVFPV